MAAEDVELVVTGDTVRLAIVAKPRAKRTEIRGVQAGALEIAIASPPVDGAANDALMRHLADVFGIPVRDVVLLAGATGRRKRVELHGLDEARVRAILATLL